MITSMTGFGRGSKSLKGVTIEVEARSVNHRFLDANFRLPQGFGGSEAALQKIVAQQLKRGRIDIFASRSEQGQSGGSEVQLNKQNFKRMLKIYLEAFELAGAKKDIDKEDIVLALLERRDVLEVRGAESNPAREEGLLLDACRQALKELSAMRAREGKALERDLLKNLSGVDAIVSKLDKLAKASPANYKRVLEARLKKISDDIESIPPERIAQELAVFADRVDVSEELTRMHSHIAQFKSVMRGNEGGRKLEFLLQEMGREINTCGSKSQSAEISNLIVEAKTLLEKMREQTANVE